MLARNISKKLSFKYQQKLLDHAKQSATDDFKTISNRSVKKTVGATGYLIGNKIANKITTVSKKLQQNNSETVTKDYDKEISKERYVSPEKRQEIIDELRLEQYDNGISKNNKVSKNSQQNNSQPVTNENDKEISKEIYTFPEEIQKLLII